MKRIIFEKYKIINLILFASVLCLVAALYVYVTQGYCIDGCSLNLKKGIINPVFSGGRWLAGILGIFLIIPSHIFRKWLFYVAPPILLITFFLVRGISVHSGNLLNPTRAQMAENGMILLSVITAIFVVTHLIFDWRNRKNLKSA